MKMSGNCILITGGASGIGFELATQLSRLGNQVIVTGRDVAKLQTAKSKIAKLETIPSDVTNPRDVEALFAQIQRQFPQTNVLINNAGIMRNINLHETAGSLEDLTREIDTNLSGPMRMIKTFLPHLKSKAEGAIVNVTSGLAFVPLPVSPVYCATKAGLHSYTLSLRVQLKKTNVKVFELAPPATQTDLLGEFNSEDMKGISIMSVTDMVSAAVKGLQNNQWEIRPGQSNQLKLMSRLAPEFILKQMSKPVDRMLAGTKH